MWYFRGRHRRGFGGIGFLFFPLFIAATHSLFMGLLIGIGVAIVLNILIRAATSTTYNSGSYGSTQTRNQYYQPYQQQNTDQYNLYYQPSQPYYQPYQQGYQPSQPEPRHESQPEGEQDGYTEQQYQIPLLGAQYDQYEQPHAQYPQEMPPMQ